MKVKMTTLAKSALMTKDLLHWKRDKKEDLFQDNREVLVSNAIKMDEVKLKYSFKSIIREQNKRIIRKQDKNS